MTLAETISDIMKQQDTIQRDMGMEGSTTFYFNAYQDYVTVTAPYVIENTRTIGSSFILSHPGLGWVGPTVAGSITCGSQPYIGDSRGAWATKSISSPDNTFVETFDGSRFTNYGVAVPVTQTTGQSDLVSDSYVYKPYAEWMRFGISAFSGKTVSAASLFMKVLLVTSPAPENIDTWNVAVGSEFTESTSAATLKSFTTGAKVTVVSPWNTSGQLRGINIKNIFDIPHNAGSSFLVLKMRASTLSTEGNTLGADKYIVIGSYLTYYGSAIAFYDRTSSLNFPYLQVVYTDAVSGTTTLWGSGSLYFANGSHFETTSIYTGSSTLSNIRLYTEGSTLNNLQLMASPNGANWETCNSASVANYNFTNTGSDLRLKFTASGGNAIMTKYECVYGLN